MLLTVVAAAAVVVVHMLEEGVAGVGMRGAASFGGVAVLVPAVGVGAFAVLVPPPHEFMHACRGACDGSCGGSGWGWPVCCSDHSQQVHCTLFLSRLLSERSVTYEHR